MAFSRCLQLNRPTVVQVHGVLLSLLLNRSSDTYTSFPSRLLLKRPTIVHKCIVFCFSHLLKRSSNVYTAFHLRLLLKRPTSVRVLGILHQLSAEDIEQ
jgi:hypothetical protein